MLVNLASAEGVEVRKFSPLHCRIFGAVVVDYWPSTSRAWVLGSRDKAREMSPVEAYELSKYKEILPEGAEDHLRNL